MVTLRGWEEADEVDPISIVRRTTFSITVVVKSEDDLPRFDLLDGLSSAIKQAVDRSDLGGTCLPALTWIGSGRYDYSGHYPEQSIDLEGGFSSIIEPDGHRPGLLLTKVQQMSATKRFMNWTNVTFTPANGTAMSITGVTSVTIDSGGSLAKFSGDGDRYVTTMVNDFNDPVVNIHSADLSSIRANPVGTVGTFSATHNDAKNGGRHGRGDLHPWPMPWCRPTRFRGPTASSARAP